MNLGFILTGELELGKDNLMPTAERVYLRFNDYQDDSFYKNTAIIEKNKEVNLKEISELILAILDFDLRIESENSKKLFRQHVKFSKIP